MIDLIDRIAREVSASDEIYLVGGAVRDLLLGNSIHDVDLAVKGSALDLAERLAGPLQLTVVPVGEEHNVVRLAQKGQAVVDIAGFAGTIHTDLARRDFTLNALAIPLSAWFTDRQVISNGGIPEGRELVPVASGVFAADGVRLLRAVRQAQQYDLTLTGDTLALLRANAEYLRKASEERVRDEFMRILSLPDAFSAVILLDQCGLLTKVIPELEPCRDCPQPPEHHEFDVLWHQLHALRFAELLTEPANKAMTPEFVEHFDSLAGDGYSRRTLLKLSALVHDLGKPDTLSHSDTYHFYQHEHVGQVIAKNWLNSLKFSQQNVDMVSTLVRDHLRPHVIIRPGVTRRAMHHFCRDLGDNLIDGFFLAMSDGLAAREQDYRLIWDDVIVGRDRLLAFSREPVNQPAGVCSFVNGNDVMREFGVDPGASHWSHLE